MRFLDCIAGVETVARQGADVEVTSIEYDSRCIKAGSLFVAMQGGSSDGNRFIDKAIAQGAASIVTDSAEAFASLPANLASAQISSGRRALSLISANFYQHPEKKLKLSAVTGTNGKTTTAFLLEGILNYARRTSVLLGTIETHIAGAVSASPHTTPESRDILDIFAQGAAAGATEAVMEMSSHALHQERTWAVPVDVAIFTNLTQDHLDYHQTMDAYAAAKAKLFAGVGTASPRVAVLNADDPYGSTMYDAAAKCTTRWRYAVANQSSQSDSAEFEAYDVQLGIGATRFLLRTPFGTAEIASHLTGIVNVYNLTAAIAAAMARGIPLNTCVEAAQTLSPVPGRFQTVPNTFGIAVIVDYAHTDDALLNLTSLARKIAGESRIITVFGCGGDRDRTKRPKMGRAAGKGSDLVIVTSDNPRSEDPQRIVDEILPGIEETGTAYEVELDRAAAIRLALQSAHNSDIVLIAGKGHEKEQILRDRTLPFDDVAVASGVLRDLEGGR